MACDSSSITKAMLILKAQLVKEKRLQEYAMLEKHIMEARAKALAYEERENEKRNRVCDDPDKLGIPSGNF